MWMSYVHHQYMPPNVDSSTLITIRNRGSMHCLSLGREVTDQRLNGLCLEPVLGRGEKILQEASPRPVRGLVLECLQIKMGI